MADVGWQKSGGSGQIGNVRPTLSRLSYPQIEHHIVSEGNPMDEKRCGGCECGDIRYEFCCEPLTCYTCHCTDCQARSGSAFTTAMAIPSVALKVTNGEPKEWRAERGVFKFCDRCGAHLWVVANVIPDFALVRVGTLDDSSWIAPVAHIWTDSALPWLELGDRLTRFPGQPESPLMLLEEWNKVHGC
jgi:hypothetical protein